MLSERSERQMRRKLRNRTLTEAEAREWLARHDEYCGLHRARRVMAELNADAEREWAALPEAEQRRLIAEALKWMASLPEAE